MRATTGAVREHADQEVSLDPRQAGHEAVRFHTALVKTMQVYSAARHGRRALTVVPFCRACYKISKHWLLHEMFIHTVTTATLQKLSAFTVQR